MKQMINYMVISAGLALGIAVIAVPQMAMAQATCYVDYKAKRNNGAGLELHYGVMQMTAAACSDSGAIAGRVSARIGLDGWALLRVLSVFDDSGLNQRRGNAGHYFLRY